ncbi:MAG: hypothetical protein JNM81_02940 [Rhodospirillaceae bacterium]|nr:hypothetical protein [Rhodospirillaceae bacterium]
MSNVSAVSAAYGYPPVQRSPAQATQSARQVAMDDRVYDPVLDPAVNPAIQMGSMQADGTQATEEVVVTAKRSAQAKPDDGSLSFWDFLDLINPLQHIPVVNTIYRDLTGDTIKTPIQLIGSTIVGGPIGFATAMVDSVIEEATGTDIGGHAMAALKGEKPKPTNVPLTDAPTQLAAAQEFVPENPYSATITASPLPAPAAQVAQAEAQPQYQAQPPRPTAMNHARDAAAVKQASAMRVPQQIAQAATQAMPGAPNEADAFVKTAQVAAQANVFPSFKRTDSVPGGVQPQKQQAAVPQTAAAEMSAARGGRFIPLSRSAMAAPVRSDVPVTSQAEMRARSRFAPGPINPSGATLAPATLAAATAAQDKSAAPKLASASNAAPVVSASTAAVTAQQAYAYGRSATNTPAQKSGPAEVPEWFDSAMLNAIDKYKAMQNTK